MYGMAKRRTTATTPRLASGGAATERKARPSRATHDVVDQLAVLLVNDELDVRDEMADLLRRRGLQVHVAADPVEARAILARTPDIGALVAETTLLEGEGLALAAEVLAGKPPFPPIELVLLTGYAETAEPPVGSLLQDLGVLREPMRLRDISAAVTAALARAASRRVLVGYGLQRQR